MTVILQQMDMHADFVSGYVPESLSYGPQLARMLVVLGSILLALLLVAKLLPGWIRKPGAQEIGDALDVIAVRRVDAKTRVVLVRAGSEHVLFAVTESGAVRLASGPSLDPEFGRVQGEGTGFTASQASESAFGGPTSSGGQG